MALVMSSCTARCHKLCLVLHATSRSVPSRAFPFSLGPCEVLFKGPGGALGEGGRSCNLALSKSSEEQEQRAPSLRPQGSCGGGGSAERSVVSPPETVIKKTGCLLKVGYSTPISPFTKEPTVETVREIQVAVCIQMVMSPNTKVTPWAQLSQ